MGLLALVAMGVCLSLGAVVSKAEPSERPGPSEGSERPEPAWVGRLVYADGRSVGCFAERFLQLARRRGGLSVAPELRAVDLLAEADLYETPMIVMSGQGDFTLSDQEVEHLAAYLRRGGLLVASAGCSDPRWARGFERALAQALPDRALTPLPNDHAIYRTLFELPGPHPRQPVDEPAMHGVFFGDRLAVVYSPLGLNDSANAGGGCCCCGGNELRNAHLINANLVAYAMTH
jgi:hypothetical protein